VAAAGRLHARRNLLATATALIEQEEIEAACRQLQRAHLRTDGDAQPPDFVEGDDTQLAPYDSLSS
jgi:hypothetical protein